MRNIYVLIADQMTTNYPNMWFIQNILLPEVPFYLEFEADGMKDSVVVYLTLQELDAQTIYKLRLQNNKIVLFHLTDNLNRDFNRTIYQYSDLVLTTHYIANIFSDSDFHNKILWVPFGFKSGVGPRNPKTLREVSQRRYLGSFAGYLENTESYCNERKLFYTSALTCQQDIVLRPTETFNKGFNACYYSMLLECSIFCPCPAGYSPETIRLFEALEMGSIPISLKHDFIGNSLCLPAPPFPLINSWEELPKLLEQFKTLYIQDIQSISHLQFSCITYWNTYKKSISGQIAKLLYKLRME